MNEAISSANDRDRECSRGGGVARRRRCGAGGRSREACRAAVSDPAFALCGCAARDVWRRQLRRARRAVGGVQVRRPGVRQRHDLHGDVADGSTAAAERQRRRRHNVELPAASDILVRRHSVRHGVRPGVQQGLQPDTDRNDFESSNPRSPHYIGKHPGNAFRELQFYPPGYVEQFEGFGCTATQYCAAMTIDSLSLDQNHTSPSSTDPNGQTNNTDCNNYVLGGEEPVNWAYITKSGVSQAPANPCSLGRSRTRTLRRSIRTTRKTCS
jgi:hypothetical protein